MRRVLWSAGWLLLLLLANAVPGLGLGDEANEVGLVVQFDDGQVETLCVGLEGWEITGADLLMRSGLGVVMDASSSMGVIICKISDLGCDYPSEPCFCQCTGGGGCAYWNYFYREPGEIDWIYSPLGAAARKVRPGSVEGWVWGDGHTPPSEQWTFEAICASPAPAPTETLVPPTPISATATDVPSPRPRPAAATGAPSLTPLPTKPATSQATATLAPPNTTTSPPPTDAVGSNIAGYWPFGLIVLVLVLVGAFVWLRRV